MATVRDVVRVQAGSVALALVLALPLAACGVDRDPPNAGGDATDDASSTSPPRPTPAREVRTSTVTPVLDSGDGPKLCSGVLESSPMECDGVPLTGWEWSDHPGHERAGETRVGFYVVSGTYDRSTFTVSDAIPRDEYDQPPGSTAAQRPTPCRPPAGGWRVVDEDKVAEADLREVIAVGPGLPGFAGQWHDEVDGLDLDLVNVAVTEDVSGAEATLRKVWGGPLCVSASEYTAEELAALADELEWKLDAQAAGASHGRVEVQVFYDDGSIQQWADETYGKGQVAVTSSLVPAG